MHYDKELTTPAHLLCRLSALERLRRETRFDVDQRGERQVIQDLEKLKERQKFPAFEDLRRRRLIQSEYWNDRRDEIDRIFFNQRFLKLALNRMLIGAFRYGDMPKQKSERRPYALLDSIFERLDLYDTTPNLEPLLDIFNLCGIEWFIDYTFGGEASEETIQYTVGIGRPGVDHVNTMRYELDHYKTTKNKTTLADVANLAIAEWTTWTRWGGDSYFKPIDDGIHCNYTNGSWYDGYK